MNVKRLMPGIEFILKRLIIARTKVIYKARYKHKPLHSKLKKFVFHLSKRDACYSAVTLSAEGVGEI